MKKYIALLACMCLIILAAVPVFATEETKITVTPSATSILERGQTVEFVVGISGDVPFTSVMVGLNFDETIFEFVGSVDNDNLGGAFLAPYTAQTPEIGLLRATEGTFTGTLQTLKFKIKDTAKFGTVNITGVGAAGQNASGNITVSFQGASVTIGCAHNFDSAEWKQGTGENSDIHYRDCTKNCGTQEKEDHDWNDGVVDPNKNCTDSGKVTFTCPTCGATKQQSIDHVWDNACDKSCNNCNQTRTVEHQYETAWTSDATGHWHKCSVCGEKKEAAVAHTPGPEPTEQAAQTCTVCGFVINPILAHVHEMRTDWHTDATHHWHPCDKSGCQYTEDKAVHDYDNVCDVDCNTCGYVRIAPHSYNPEWQGNQKGHYHVCSICGMYSEVYTHTPGPDATQDTPQICQDCNFWIKWPLNHTHTFGETWYSDDANHWQSCVECMETTALERHVFGQTVVTKEPTQTETGSQQKLCSICAMQITEEIPALGQPTQAGTNPTVQPGTEESGRFPWEIAGIGAVLLLIAGIVLLVIEFLKSRKTNMHGRFSK